MTASVRTFLVLTTLAVSASCHLEEPAAIDGLGPDTAADSLVITPQDITVPVGSVVIFAAPDETVEGTPVTGPTEWTVAGGEGGTITMAGVFQASDTGGYEVRGKRSGKTGRSNVTVTNAPATLTSVRVAPDAVTLQPGATFTFAVSGVMSDGSTVPVTGTWTATGGTIDNTGAYHAGSTAGQFRVIATQQNGTRADTATVTISAAAPTLQAVEVTPATVNLTPGGIQQFSAVGRMSDGSSASVTVTWSETGGSITSAGRYTAGTTAGTFRVVATQQGGTKADTSVVTITPAAPTLTGIEVTPQSVNLAPGDGQQFSAIGRMSDGSTSSVSVNWSATGGTVSGTGAYTAGASAGTFRVVATQQGGTRADTASVTIAAPPPTITLQAIELTPASASLLTGGTQQFSAVGRMSDNSTSSVAVTWSATGGTVSGSGLYTAGSSPGTWRIIAVQQGGTKADTATVTVSAPAPTLVAVELTPASVSLLTSASQQFSVVGRMSDGSTSGVTVNWTATGGTIGTGGLYTAGSTPGTFRVIATQQGGAEADTSSVTISAPAPTLTAIELTPSSVSLTTGATQQFSAVGRMSDGSTSAVSVNFSETGGTITAGGLFTAGSTPGTFRVIATQQGGTEADTSTVTITAPVPVLTAVEVSPTSASLTAGATQQFMALGRMSDGSTTGVLVTWSETGGSISGTGLYTAGSTAGSFRVIAVQQGGTKADTASVTITAAAPTLSAVEVTPATVSLATGATQQFTAVGRMSDGSTQAVTVTWSETGGAITTGGLYTAGSTGGTYQVIAVQEGGTRADTSAVTVTASPPPPPSGGTPDPALLPAATGQAAVSASAYTALPYYSASGTQLGTNPRNMPVGSYYVDPTTGVKVVRLTSPTAPYSSSGMWMSGVDYAEGGLRVGRPSGTSYPIPVVSVGSGGGQGFRLITFDLSSYAVGLRGSLPGGSAEIARAMSYVTPNVMYTIDGGVLRKWNVAGSTAVEIVSAPFPKDLRGHLHGQSTFTWFQGSDDDRWFSMMAGFSGPYLVGFDAQTNTVTEKSVSGIDEPKMDRDGRYVWARGSTPYVWDMQANTLTSVSGSQPSYDGHGGVTRGYAFGNPNDGRAGWSINLKSATPSYQYLGAAFNLDNMYLQGGWVDQAAGGTTAQWVALGYQTGGGGEPGPMKYRYGALGLYKLDGSDHRLLANAYNSGNVNGTPDYYANTLWPNLAPDGKFLLFKSNQLVAAGFSSLFAAIVPAQ